MSDPESTGLLTRYLRQRDDAVFAELVRRYAGLVRGTRLRCSRKSESFGGCGSIQVDFDARGYGFLGSNWICKNRKREFVNGFLVNAIEEISVAILASGIQFIAR